MTRFKFIVLFIVLLIPTSATGTMLHEAAKAGDIERVKRLLAARADTEARDRDGFTALRRAAIRGHGAVVKVLLEGGADMGRGMSTEGRRCGGRQAGGHGDVVKGVAGGWGGYGGEGYGRIRGVA